MTQQVPALPTTEQLQNAHPVNTLGEIEVALGRERISELLSGSPGLVAVLGPCAMTGDTVTIQAEGELLAEHTRNVQGLYVAHRIPPWKPRTNPDDWHGEETTNPSGAYRTLADEVNQGRGVSMELGRDYHPDRYGHLLVLGWLGGRNNANDELAELVALHDTAMPLAVKNGLDGDVEAAAERVERLSNLRSMDAAPVVLLYRGGENAKTPDEWERQYRLAAEITGGRLIIDIAHGTEMAHDPDGEFKKSVAGQVAALAHLIRLAEEDPNLAPAGIMAEASAAHSPTDPHMPLDIALSGVLRLHEIRTGMVNVSA